MREEAEIRDRLASEVIAYAGFASKDSKAARAAHERIRTLTWILENTDPDTMPPSERGNGTPEAE